MAKSSVPNTCICGLNFQLSVTPLEGIAIAAEAEMNGSVMQDPSVNIAVHPTNFVCKRFEKVWIAVSVLKDATEFDKNSVRITLLVSNHGGRGEMSGVLT
jgi:hypothetical protein